MFLPPAGPVDRIYCKLIGAQKLPGLGLIIRQCLKLRGIDIPPQVLRPGTGLVLRHAGNVVIHVKTRIGKNVMLHQGSTVGRADIWRPAARDFGGFVLEDNVILGANSVVTSKHGTLTVSEGTVLGANSVLTQSTGPYEIWAGVPAKLIGHRENESGERDVHRSPGE